MFDFALVFVLQLLFQLMRVTNTKMVVADNMWGVQLTTQGIQILWLITTYLGVMAMQNQDWWIIAGFLVGGGVGAWISMKYTKTKKE